MNLVSLALILFIYAISDSTANADEIQGGLGNLRNGRGISFQLEIGLPSVSIANPDGTFAYYNGIGLQGRGFLPLIDSHLISFNLVGSAKYLDLNNTANRAQQKEVANLIGPGVGANLMFWKLFGGVDYQMIFGRHYGIGPISQELNYNFAALQQYYGMQWEFGALIVGGAYSTMNATIPKSMTGLSVDSNYSEQVYWLFLRYSTGYSIEHLFKTLFSH